jgi:hypothetical protein
MGSASANNVDQLPRKTSPVGLKDVELVGDEHNCAINKNGSNRPSEIGRRVWPTDKTDGIAV